MEIPRSMFPRPVRGIPSNSGASSVGDGGGGGGGPKRNRSSHEQSGSGAFLQASKISPFRQPRPSGIGEHPSPDGSAGRDDVSPGTHITKGAFEEEDADSSSLPNFRGAGNRWMPSPTYPEVEAAGFDSGAGIAENSGLPGTSTYGDSSTDVEGCGEGLKAEAANGPLGFGFEAMKERLWELGSESRGEGRGGRDRSTSRHEVDGDFDFGELRGNSGDRSVDAENTTALGCDLGWGAEGTNFDDSPEEGGSRWRERVDEEQAEEPGHGEGQEGR